MMKLWKRPDGSHYECVEKMADADVEVKPDDPKSSKDKK